jgi:hypothetical protein
MRSMQSQAFELVGAGLTTVDDVVRSVYAPGMDLDEGEPVAAGGSPTPPPTTSTPIPIPTPTSTSTPPPSPSPATAAAASGAGAAGEGRPADERLTIVLPAGDPFAPPGSAREAG